MIDSSKEHRIGLYLHIPFCQHKCSYCDFYSVVSLNQIEKFGEALVKEVARRASEIDDNLTISSIFWGGGTPSLLHPRQTEDFAIALSRSFRFDNDLEWTIEANPGTVDLEKLRLYRQLGVNRISFGVQSFDERELQFLERIHTAQQAIQAVEMARQAGFDNINIDLIYGLPNQQLDVYRRTLEMACNLRTEHISAYNLVYEEATPLYHQLQRGEISPLEENQEYALYTLTVEILEMYGYQQYEVSNFARERRQCQHNLLYWRHGRYLGFGPSAHSFLGNTRWWNVRSVTRYCDYLENGQFPIAASEYLTAKQDRLEKIFLGLRAEGLPMEWLVREDDGVRYSSLDDLIKRWLDEGWASISEGILHLTWRGYFVCDTLVLELMEVLENTHSITRFTPHTCFVDCINDPL